MSAQLISFLPTDTGTEADDGDDGDAVDDDDNGDEA
jgi:hypothetical protein